MADGTGQQTVLGGSQGGATGQGQQPDPKTQDQGQGQGQQQGQAQGGDKGNTGAASGQKQNDSQAQGQPPPEKPKAPEKYELKLPKDSQLDPSAVEKIASYAKERGLSQEQAQELLTRENDAVKSFTDKMFQNVKETQTKWVETIKSDKEIGGDEFAKNAELAKRVVQKFASESFAKELNETGLGNHPELVRLLVRIGKGMSEDQLVKAGASPGTKKSIADILYNGQ